MFQNSVFSEYIKNIDKNLLDKKYQKFKEIYQDPSKIEQIKSSKEEQYQEGFLRDVFVNILGYTIHPEPNYNLITEKRNESSDKKDTRKADAAIIIDNKTKCVIELKGTNTTDLKKVEDQAFIYKNHNKGCRYVVISNFAKLRFYIDDATKFIEFDLFGLDYDNFEKLYTLLAYEQIKADIPARIKEQSISREEDITKKFYKDYSDFKNALFDNICELNPSFDKLELFTKTQKLLDRFLFIFFCEDKGLLAPNSMDEILERYKKLKRWDEYKPLYDLIKKFFAWIDTGFKNEIFDIFAYNGGLFKTDDLLDNLKISDDLLQKHCKKLADYNFDSDVSVDILGHIFEHSISEIEIKQNELKGIQKADKRKKDGVFYTPAYITKYIVESTLGTLCEAKKNELGINDADFADINANKRKDKISKIAILKKYREFLFGLKICDPACGSGAFLNATLKFLKAEHQLIDEMENNFYGTPLQLNYNDNKILENNIYGVDINSESVDIAKLSLWLNTAKKGEKLTTLTDNIKCGNSLISEEFDWQKEFPEVFENGGFDVIIGNPPYVSANTQMDGSSMEKQRGILSKSVEYKTLYQKWDLYTAFIERGFSLLKNKGFFGFIVPYPVTNQTYAKLTRQMLTSEQNIFEIADFNGTKIFADAVVESCILLATKENHKGQINISHIDENNAINIAYAKTSAEFIQDEKTQLWNTSENFQNSNRHANMNVLGDFCYISVGMVLNADEKTAKGEFVKDDLISDTQDEIHCRKFIEGKNCEKYNVSKIRYLEYNTERVPNRLRRPTFPELYKNQKLMFNRLGNLQVFFDEVGDFTTSDAMFVCLLWKDLRGVENKSISNSIKKFSKLARQEMETLSENMNLKYILAIMNSKYASVLLTNLRGGDYHIYPEHIRNIPIPNIAPESQKQLADFADEMIRLNAEISSLSNDFFTILCANYEIAKIPTALNEFYNLDFKEFLKLTKLKIDMSEQKDLLKFFNEYKTKFKTLNEQILTTESKINQAVYKLYELNDDEIKMIENS